MRAFLVLSVLFAIGYAAPQYNYDGSAIQTGPGRGGEKYLPPPGTTQAPIINKKFYIISAPEDHSNDGKTKTLVLGRPQKTYRVVFIKAPAGDNDNVKYAAEFAPQEEKTVIYVLKKQDNELTVDDIATPAPTQPSKPEVFFIKYKTDEEAEQAQKEIQGEYNKYGGTSEVSDEGVAPLTSIVGSLDGLNPDGSYNYQPIKSGSSNLAQPLQPPAPVSVGLPVPVPSTQYLPSIFRA